MVKFHLFCGNYTLYCVQQGTRESAIPSKSNCIASILKFSEYAWLMAGARHQINEVNGHNNLRRSLDCNSFTLTKSTSKPRKYYKLKFTSVISLQAKYQRDQHPTWTSVNMHCAQQFRTGGEIQLRPRRLFFPRQGDQPQEFLTTLTKQRSGLFAHLWRAQSFPHPCAHVRHLFSSSGLPVWGEGDDFVSIRFGSHL